MRLKTIFQRQSTGSKMIVTSEYSDRNIKYEVLRSIGSFVSRYDANKDGYLCRNELKRMMIKRRMPWTENSLNQLIDDVDKDKDGKLTFREVR